MCTVLKIDIWSLDKIWMPVNLELSYFSILYDRNIAEREFENRFPSYIGLGLYWEYEGTAWLQNTCHRRL